MRPRACRLAMLTILLSATSAAPARSNEALDLIIRGGLLYDGTGAPPRRADIGVCGDRIVFVGPSGERTARTIIEADGLAVAPGFIDPHSHVLESAPAVAGPFVAAQNLAQGITTAVIGADGGLAPRDLVRLSATLKRKGSAGNWFCYVGHNGIRRQVMGSEQRAATAAELARMKALVLEGMALGCAGLSAGLMYDPGMFSPSDEIVALAREVRPFNGTYDAHSRNPVTDFLASELETAEIGIKAGVPAKLGHVKAVGLSNRGKAAELIRRVDALRSAGHDVVADIYPYDGAQTNRLAGVLVFPGQPPITAGRPTASIMADLRGALAVPETRAALKAATERGFNGGFAWIKAVGYDSVRIVDAPNQPELVGKYLSQMADYAGREPFDVLVDILLKAKGDIIVTVGAMDEKDVRALLRQTWNMISSDGSFIGPGSVYKAAAHPRSSGSFARVLGHYSRDVRLFPLEEAVRKMTSLPAAHLRLNDRGKLAAGMIADIVMFDAGKVADQADYVHPERLATGVVNVFVNGTSVWKDGRATGARPGRFVPRQTASRANPPTPIMTKP